MSTNATNGAKEPDNRTTTNGIRGYTPPYAKTNWFSRNQIESMANFQIDSASAGKASVTLTKPDTGYQVRYHFKKNGCWILERIEDWSI